jgi:hypothetical protein
MTDEKEMIVLADEENLTEQQRAYRLGCSEAEHAGIIKQLEDWQWPPALVKAVDDSPWDYALRLRTGELLFFNGATFLN